MTRPPFLVVVVALYAALCASPAGAKLDEQRAARALSSLVAAALAEGASYEVITEADLRGAVRLEVEKQLTGCTDESCMTEIAGALGSRYVVLSQLDAVGETLVLHVTLYDSEEARVLQRAGVTGTSERELADSARVAARGFAHVLDEVGAERVLVLDARTPPPPEQESVLGVVAMSATAASGGLLALTWLATAGLFTFVWSSLAPNLETRDFILLNVVPLVGPFLAVAFTGWRFAPQLSYASGAAQLLFGAGALAAGALWWWAAAGEDDAAAE